MLSVVWSNPRVYAFAMVLGGAFALYAASLIGVRALAGRDPGRAGWRAVGHWLPMAAVVLAAAALRRADLAVGVVFATTVAALSLMLGILAYFSSIDDHPAGRRGWPFVLPAALLALLAGFSGRLSLLHAGAMALLGLAVWAVWTEPTLASTLGPPAEEDEERSEALPRRPGRPLLLLLALALAGAGGYLAAFGAGRASDTSRWLPAGLLAAAVLSPLLTMPMLASSSTLAERGHASSMASTLVAVALLNLCALLPASILVWHVQPGATQLARRLFTDDPAATASTRPGPEIDHRYATADEPLLGVLGAGAEPMPYPLTVWRIDTVLVLVLGFALIPVALGRWSLGRAEAGGLIVAYAVYLAMTMAMAGRV